MSKIIGKRILIFVLCLAVLAGGALGLIYFLKPASKASAVEVITKVSDSLNQVNETLTNGANSETTSDVSLTSITNFEKATIGDFLVEQSYFNGFVHGLSYVARNATKENGYANEFELNKIYSGVAAFLGEEGMLYFVINEVEGGLDCQIDFVFNAEVGGENIVATYKINAFFGYNYSTDEVEIIKMNFVQYPNANFVWASEMDIKNNSFKMIYIRNHNLDNTEQQAQTFVSKYNNGSLSFADAVSLPWDLFAMYTGNIADNINDIDFDGYIDNESGAVSNIVTQGMYTGIYNVLKNLNLRTSTQTLDYNNTILVNFMKDAAKYGENKATIWRTEVDGREYFSTPFLEYQEILNYLNNAKQTMANDNKYTDKQKSLVSDAIGYLTNRGEKKYVGELGVYNGRELFLDLDTEFKVDNGTVSVIEEVFIQVKSTAFAVQIDLNKQNNQIIDIHTGTLTKAELYAKIKNDFDTYDYMQDVQYVIDFLNDCEGLSYSTDLVTTWSYGDWRIVLDESYEHKIVITCSRYPSAIVFAFGAWFNDYWRDAHYYADGL